MCNCFIYYRNKKYRKRRAGHIRVKTDIEMNAQMDGYENDDEIIGIVKHFTTSTKSKI